MKFEEDFNVILLLEQLKQGNESAFNELYHRYSKILLSNMRNLVKNNEIAKELLQNLFLKVWEKRESIDTNKSFRSFLFTIAQNMVYDYFRKVALDKKAMVRLMTTTVEFYSHTEEDLELKESSEMFSNAIETLPSQRKRVYLLSKVEGKSHGEISKILNISISTVNNHMVKANHQIRSYLIRHGNMTLIIAGLATQLLRK